MLLLRDVWPLYMGTSKRNEAGSGQRLALPTLSVVAAPENTKDQVTYSLHELRSLGQGMIDLCPFTMRPEILTTNIASVLSFHSETFFKDPHPYTNHNYTGHS